MDLPWAVFGENLTTEGLLEAEVRIGDRFRVGSAEFVVTQPRLPCYKLGIRLGRMDILKRFLHSGRTASICRHDRGRGRGGRCHRTDRRADEGLTVADVVNLYTVDAKNQDLLRARPSHRHYPRAGETISASGSGSRTLEPVILALAR